MITIISSSALNSSQTSTDSAIEAAERAIFGTSKLTIEDLAMQNIHEGKEYLNEEE